MPKVLWMMVDVTLYHGDCLTEMDRIADGSIDAIIADLPYGTTACRWDTTIPLEPLWKHYKRVIKPRGAIVLFGSQPFTSRLVTSNMEWFKYCLVWEKTIGSGFINCKNRPISKHEDLCIFSPGTTANRSPRRMTYNPQGLIYAPYHKNRNKPMTAKPGGFLGTRPSHVAEYDVEYVNYPCTILKFPNPNNKLVHPTQKPIALLEYLVRTYTNENETVLDNCFGSCTTGVACLNANRDFVGIEKNKEYFRIGKARVADARWPLPVAKREQMALPLEGV